MSRPSAAEMRQLADLLEVSTTLGSSLDLRASLRPDADGLAAQVAGGPLVSQGICKRAIDDGLSLPLADGLLAERDAFVEAFRTEDSQIGVKSFLENGPGKAEFTGR